MNVWTKKPVVTIASFSIVAVLLTAGCHRDQAQEAPTQASPVPSPKPTMPDILNGTPEPPPPQP
jgi:hypothetical protein